MSRRALEGPRITLGGLRPGWGLNPPIYQAPLPRPTLVDGFWDCFWWVHLGLGVWEGGLAGSAGIHRICPVTSVGP